MRLFSHRDDLPSFMNDLQKKQVALLHGAGYAGGELIRLLGAHPGVALTAVTSRSHAGQPVWKAHPSLRGQTDLVFVEEAAAALPPADALVTAAAHGESARELPPLLAGRFEGAVVDLSADFRLNDPAHYQTWHDDPHPAPALLETFAYGLPEVRAPYAPGTRRVANPGCFATAVALALWPLAQHWPSSAPFQPAVTALTGASGSGAQPSAATHFPDRAGNVRAYKVLAHQHEPEILDVMGRPAEMAFTPASGPWTRGIWGTAHLLLPDGYAEDDVNRWFAESYDAAPFVRCSPGALPELRHAARTPFCDLGWQVEGAKLVVGFALDNLLKGAASQAVQNLNRLMDLPEAMGLLPQNGGPQMAGGGPSRRKQAGNPTSAHAADAAA